MNVNMGVVDFRVKANLWVALAGIAFLLPFSINNLLNERYALAAGSFFIIIIVSINAFLIKKGKFYPQLPLFGMVPAILIFLTLAFQKQGIIAALWSYPAIAAFYFMLPERSAAFSSIALLVIASVSSLFIFELSLASRVIITLLITIVYTAIFMRIIGYQEARLKSKELLRREGMASISHELRTPIASLMIQIEAIQDGVRSFDKKNLTGLHDSAKHLNHLVDDLYQLTLADVGELRIHLEEIDWDSVLMSAINAVKPKLESRQLQIKLNVDNNVTIQGDAIRMRQIIDNLLQNCSRYSDKGSTIEIVLKKFTHKAVLTVSDSGPGVSDEALKNLFERFYRVDVSRNKGKGGTGLGLSLVYALTHAHNGEVVAQHSSQGGLAISISIPLSSKDD